MKVDAAGLEALRDLQRTVIMAFRAAYLLTASIQQAEAAVLAAIDRFDPDRDTKEILLQNAIRAAVQCPSTQSQSAEALPLPELQAVLSLPATLRRCFVLRVLVGLSRSACAGLLRFSVGDVNGYTCSALQAQAGFDVANYEEK